MPVLAGTDVTGSIPREVALLARMGLEPQQALAAASSWPRPFLGAAATADNARMAGRPAGTSTRMACRISELVIDSRDPERLAAFWCDVLGYVVLDRVENSVEIGPEDQGFGGLQPTIVFDLTDKPKAGKLPLHIDVNPTDRDQDEELERLLAVGAKPADVGQTGEESWHVLADPEGNEFCLLRRRLSG